jgi:type IV pilus assembly protein PilQ
MNLRFHNEVLVKPLALVLLLGGLSPATRAAAPGASPEQGNGGLNTNVQAGSLVESLSKESTDFNFTNMDILFILKTFASRFDKNIIPSDSVSGKVTLSLKRVPFDEAFQILLEKMNLAAIQRSGNIIEVMRKSEMPLIRETFSLKTRQAGDIKTTLEALLTMPEKERLTIAVDGASNSLIITANTTQIGKIRSLIGQLDIKSPQVRIKTRIVELTDGSSLSTGISWGGALRHGGVTARAAKDIGTLQTVTPGGVTPTPGLVNTAFGEGAFFDLSQVMDKAALYAVLNLLATDSKGKTLSEPSIMTGNNKTALIHVGKNLPVVTTSVSQTASVQSVSYIKEGIDLEVTPVVSPGSKQVSMRVRINVSELSGFQANNPITTERSAYTEITMESEKTVAIGGLVRENVQNSSSGIPVLRSIPLIGALFRSKEKTTEKTELLIFLTPEIVTDEPEVSQS